MFSGLSRPTATAATWAPARARTVDAAYLTQVAVAVDTLGHDGVLLPTGRACEDAWVVTSSLLHATRQRKFLVAISGPTCKASCACQFFPARSHP